MPRRDVQGAVMLPFDCLVCGKPTFATHMGMDACRACTVFYRRNRDVGDKLLCINGNGACMKYKKNFFSCRRCRFYRFEAVVRAGISEHPSPPPPYFPEPHKDAEFDRLQQLIIPPRAPGNSIIERIRVNLRALSAFRCAGEMRLRGVSILPAETYAQNYGYMGAHCRAPGTAQPCIMVKNRPPLLLDRYDTLIPCTYQFMEDATKILIPGLFEFAQLTFPDFGALSPANRWMVIRNYEKIFHCVDAEMRTRRRFGKESSHVFGTYTSLLSLDCGAHFFSDCPNKANIGAATDTVCGWLRENVPKLKRQESIIDPTEEEYLAIIGLALWSLENVDASDELLAIASRNRTQIVAELSTQYRRTIGSEGGAGRIGALMCLLQEFRRSVMTIGSDYQIYLMLGVFDEHTLMSKLPVS